MYFWSTHSSLLVMTLVMPYFGERVDNMLEWGVSEEGFVEEMGFFHSIMWSI